MVEITEDTTPEVGCLEKHDLILHRLNCQDLFLLETFANYKPFIMTRGSKWTCCQKQIDPSNWPVLKQLANRDPKEVSQKATPTPVIQHTKMQTLAPNPLVVNDRTNEMDVIIDLEETDDESVATGVSRKPASINHQEGTSMDFSPPPCDDDNVEDNRSASNCCEGSSNLMILSSLLNTTNNGDPSLPIERNGSNNVTQPDKNLDDDMSSDSTIDTAQGQSTEVTRVSECAQKMINLTHARNSGSSMSHVPGVQKDCHQDPEVVELSSDEELEPTPSNNITTSTNGKSIQPKKVSVRHSINARGDLLGLPSIKKLPQRKTSPIHKNNTAHQLSNFGKKCRKKGAKSENTAQRRTQVTRTVDPIRIVKVNNQYSTTSPPSLSIETEKPVDVRKSPSVGEETSTSSLSETEVTPIGEYDDKMDANSLFIPEVVYTDDSQENSQAIESGDYTANPEDTLTMPAARGPSIIIGIGPHSIPFPAEQEEENSDFSSISLLSPNGLDCSVMELSPLSTSSDRQQEGGEEIIQPDAVNEKRLPNYIQPQPVQLLRTKASIKCMETDATQSTTTMPSTSTLAYQMNGSGSSSPNDDPPPLLPAANSSAESDHFSCGTLRDSKKKDAYCADSVRSVEETEDEVILLESSTPTSIVAVIRSQFPSTDNTVNVVQLDLERNDTNNVVPESSVVATEALEEPRFSQLLIPQRNCAKQVVYSEADEKTGTSMRKSKRRRTRSTRMKGFLTKGRENDGSDSEDEERPHTTKSFSLNADQPSSNWSSVVTVESPETVHRKRRPGRPRGSRNQRSKRSRSEVSKKRAKALTDVEDTVPMKSFDGARTDWNASDEEPLIKKREKNIGKGNVEQGISTPVTGNRGSRLRKISLRKCASSKKVYTEVSSSDEESSRHATLRKKPKCDILNEQSPVPGPSSSSSSGFPTVPYRPPTANVGNDNEDDLTTEEEMNNNNNNNTGLVSSILKDRLLYQSSDSPNASTVVLSVDEEDPDATCIITETPSSLSLTDSQTNTPPTSAAPTPLSIETKKCRRRRATCDRCGKNVTQSYLQAHYESKVCKKRQENGGITAAEDSQTETEPEDCITNNDGKISPRKPYKKTPKAKVACEFCRKPLLPKNVRIHEEKYCKFKRVKVDKQPPNFLSQTEKGENSQVEGDDNMRRKQNKLDSVECEKCRRVLKKNSMARHRDTCKGRKSNARDEKESKNGNEHASILTGNANGIISYGSDNNNIVTELFIGNNGSATIEVELEREINLPCTSREVNLACTSRKAQKDELLDWFCNFEDCSYEPENQRDYEEHVMEHPPDEGFPCDYPECNYVFFCKLNMVDHRKGHVKTLHHDATMVSIKNNKRLQPSVVLIDCQK